ncbi:MAG: glycosyltransferase [Planctomycetota bacterium]
MGQSPADAESLARYLERYEKWKPPQVSPRPPTDETPLIVCHESLDSHEAALSDAVRKEMSNGRRPVVLGLGAQGFSFRWGAVCIEAPDTQALALAEACWARQATGAAAPRCVHIGASAHSPPPLAGGGRGRGDTEAPLFSVVMPVYNHAQFVGAALDSLLAQTCPDWEAVVVNDGSTDATPEVLRKYQLRDSRVRVFHQENAGVGAAINTGLRQVRGQWVCLLAADDLYDPRKLEIHQAWIARYPDCRFFHSHFRSLDDSTGTISDPPVAAMADWPREFQVLSQLKCNTVHGPGVCIARECFAAVGDFNVALGYALDYDMWLRLMRRFPAVYIPERTAITRIHGGQISGQNPESCSFDAARSGLAFLNQFPFHDYFPLLSLNQPEVALKCLNEGLSAALTPCHIYGLGPHPALLLRILEWVQSECPKQVRQEARGQLPGIFATAAQLHGKFYLGSMCRALAAAVQMPRVTFKYSALNVLEVAEPFYLEAAGRGHSGTAELARYLERTENWKPPHTPPQPAADRTPLVTIPKRLDGPEAVFDSVRQDLASAVRPVVLGLGDHGLSYRRGAVCIEAPDAHALARAAACWARQETGAEPARYVNIGMVTYNRLAFTRQAIEGLCAHTTFPHVLSVVDNASSDGTRELLLRLHQEGVINNLLLLEQNIGVAKAANLAWVQEPRASYFLKLDNDIVIRKPGWLEALVETIDKLPEAGVVGYNFEPKSYPLVEIRGVPVRIKEDGNLGGACYLIPKRTEEKLGKWCEAYARYGFEDVDYSARVGFIKLKNAYMPDEDIGLHLPAGKAPVVDGRTWQTRDGIEEIQQKHYRDFKDNEMRVAVGAGWARARLNAQAQGRLPLCNRSIFDGMADPRDMAEIQRRIAAAPPPGTAGVPPAQAAATPGSAGVPPAQAAATPGSAGVPPARAAATTPSAPVPASPPTARRFAGRKLRVDLGCGDHRPEGFIGVDVVPGPCVDVVANLTRDFPFDDNSVACLRAHDAIEHWPDRLHTMNEIWRVCEPGAVVDLRVPSTDGRGAFQDPTHVSFWNANSFYYYSVEHPQYLNLSRKQGFKGGFRISQLQSVQEPDHVFHVHAVLTVVKEAPAPEPQASRPVYMQDPKLVMLEELKQAVRADPANRQPWNELAKFCQIYGMLNEAAALAAELAVEQPQQPGILLAAAGLSRMVGNHDAARSYYERVLELDPANREARAYLKAKGAAGAPPASAGSAGVPPASPPAGGDAGAPSPPPAPAAQAVSAPAALAPDMAQLAAERDAFVQRWLKLKPHKLGKHYLEDMSKEYKLLRASGVQDCPLTPANSSLLETLAKDYKRPLSDPRAQQAVLAALLYRRPYLLGLEPDLAGAPAWMFADYVSQLLSPPAVFQELGEVDACADSLAKVVEQLCKIVKTAPQADVRREAARLFMESGNFLPFYFTRRNLREVYRQRGEILELGARVCCKDLDYEFPARIKNAPLRLGILANAFHANAETFASLPVYENIGSGFEVCLYSVFASPTKRLEDYCRGRAAGFRNLPGSVAEAVELIRRDNLDILYFATNVTAVANLVTILAAFRLARIQAAGPGSVTTSGLRHMDYYISGELSDPAPDAPAHYTEKLAKLRGSAHCFSYGTETGIGKMSVTRAHLGASPGEVLLVAPANMNKLIPEQLHTLARILAGTARSRLVLFPYGPHWQPLYPKALFEALLSKTLARQGLPRDRVTVVDLPNLNREDIREFMGELKDLLKARGTERPGKRR